MSSTLQLANAMNSLSCYFEDHFAGRYHVNTPLGLIIDGAVNDLRRAKASSQEVLQLMHGIAWLDGNLDNDSCQMPEVFLSFLAAICRNLSLNRLDWRMAA